MDSKLEETIVGVVDTYLRTLDKDLGCFDGRVVVTEDCYSSSWLVKVVNGVTKVIPYPENTSEDSVDVDDCYVALASHRTESDGVLYFVSGPEYRDTINSGQSPNIFKPVSEDLLLLNEFPRADAPVCAKACVNIMRAVHSYFDIEYYKVVVGWPIALRTQLEYHQGGESYVREVDYIRNAMGCVTMELLDMNDVYVPIHPDTDVTVTVIGTGNFAHLPHRVGYGPKDLEYNTTRNLVHLARWHRDMLEWEGDMILPIPTKGHSGHLVVPDGEGFTAPGNIYWSPTVIRSMIRSLTASIQGTDQNQTDQFLRMVLDLFEEARVDIDLEEDMGDLVVWTLTPNPSGDGTRLMRYHVTADTLHDGVVSDHSVAPEARPTHPIGTLPFRDDKIMEILFTNHAGYTISISAPDAYQTKDEE